MVLLPRLAKAGVEDDGSKNDDDSSESTLNPIGYEKLLFGSCGGPCCCFCDDVDDRDDLGELWPDDSTDVRTPDVCNVLLLLLFANDPELTLLTGRDWMLARLWFCSACW